jgi:hypothetical protein
MGADKLAGENIELSSQESYICIDPDEGKSIYKYFNSVLSEEEARRFEEHLLICFKCQAVIFSLDKIIETLREDRDEIFQADKQESEDNRPNKACGKASE